MKATLNWFGVIGLAICFTLTLATMGHAQTAAGPGGISAAEALFRYEKALQSTSDPDWKFYLSTRMTATALAAGEKEKAQTYAHALLAQAAAMQKNWNYGNAIQVANLVLGQIALSANDLAGAKRFLLEAGKSPGSPQLNSFGPNMLLAKELLAKGERETVLEYFDLCAVFWKSGSAALSHWKSLVTKGETPNFGANLGYQLDEWRFQNWDALGAR